MKTSSNPNPSIKRTIGLDCHPDSFTAAFLIGETPAAAHTQKIHHKKPTQSLSKWAQTETTPDDCIVLEASGNSFYVARLLRSLNRKALVLESAQLGRLKEVHANNDKISAVRIGKAYLAGTAKEVWVPDPKTQELRDIFLAYKKAIKRSTQSANRINSFLSDHGIRIGATGKSNLQALLSLYPWSGMEKTVLTGYFTEYQQAEENSTYWEKMIGACVLEDELMLSLVRQCGVRHITAFALRAIIGDINRFKSSAALVNYVKLSGKYDDSGNEESKGKVGHVGRRDLRSLLVQGAQAVLSSNNDIGKWGRKLLLKGKKHINVVVIAVARKMLVAVWYLMEGRWTSLESVDGALNAKINKIIIAAGVPKKERPPLKEQVLERMLKSRKSKPEPLQEKTASKMEKEPAADCTTQKTEASKSPKRSKKSSLRVAYGLEQDPEELEARTAVGA